MYDKAEAPQSVLRSCVQGSASTREALGVERQEKILFQGCAAGLGLASSRPLEVLEGSTGQLKCREEVSAPTTGTSIGFGCYEGRKRSLLGRVGSARLYRNPGCWTRGWRLGVAVLTSWSARQSHIIGCTLSSGTERRNPPLSFPSPVSLGNLLQTPSQVPVVDKAPTCIIYVFSSLLGYC